MPPVARWISTSEQKQSDGASNVVQHPPFSRVITNTGTSWKMETDALYNLGETNAVPRAN